MLSMMMWAGTWREGWESMNPSADDGSMGMSGPTAVAMTSSPLCGTRMQCTASGPDVTSKPKEGERAHNSGWATSG